MEPSRLLVTVAKQDVALGDIGQQHVEQNVLAAHLPGLWLQCDIRRVSGQVHLSQGNVRLSPFPGYFQVSANSAAKS